MLHGMGLHTGIDLERLVDTSQWICHQLQRRNQSRVALAMGTGNRGNGDGDH